MAPLTDVLIAKIVLGYLSSRNLSKTSDCFVKESSDLNINTSVHKKGRILNHLEDQNLLPSLEEILHDYFAYQETDDNTSDKTYLLWKQLDVIISQLRALTLGRKKAKAFLRTRKIGNNLNQVFTKRDNNVGRGSPDLFKPKLLEEVTESFLKSSNHDAVSSVQFNEQTCNTSMFTTVPYSTPLKENIPTAQTPRKEELKNEVVKEFKSPKRKSVHPKRRSVEGHKVTDLTPVSIKISDADSAHSISPLLINEEFNQIVQTLMGNYQFSEKLADNINKVVCSESEGEKKDVKSKEKNHLVAEEVFKLTADDPDLGGLFAMLGDLNADDPIKQNYYFPSKENLNDIFPSSSSISISQTRVTSSNTISPTSSIIRQVISSSKGRNNASCTHNISSNLYSNQSTTDVIDSGYVQPAGACTLSFSNLFKPITTTMISSKNSTESADLCPGTSHKQASTNTPKIPNSNSSFISPPSFSNLFSSDSNLFSCAGISKLLANQPSSVDSCVRNLKDDLNICSDSPGHQTLKSTKTKDNQSDILCPVASSITDSSGNSQFVKCSKTDISPSVSNLPDRMYEPEEAYLDIPTTSPKCRETNTPTKITSAPKKKLTQKPKSDGFSSIDEESVSIATDALLLLATSPAKPFSKSDTGKFSFMKELMDSLSQESFPVSKDQLFTAPSTSTAVAVPSTNVQSSQLLVSDRSALSVSSYESYFLGSNNNHDKTFHNQQQSFFESPHKNLENLTLILPKDQPRSYISSELLEISRKEIASVEQVNIGNRHKGSMSLAEQLEKKGQIIKQKQRKPRKAGTASVVTRLLTFNPLDPIISSPALQPIVEIIAVDNNCSNTLKSLSPPIQLSGAFNNDNKFPTNTLTKCSSRIRPILPLNHLGNTNLNSSNTAQPLACQDTTSKFIQNFRIMGDTIHIAAEKVKPLQTDNRNLTLKFSTCFAGEIQQPEGKFSETLPETFSTLKPSLKVKSKEKNESKSGLKVKFNFKSPKKRYPETKKKQDKTSRPNESYSIDENMTFNTSECSDQFIVSTSNLTSVSSIHDSISSSFVANEQSFNLSSNMKLQDHDTLIDFSSSKIDTIPNEIECDKTKDFTKNDQIVSSKLLQETENILKSSNTSNHLTSTANSSDSRTTLSANSLSHISLNSTSVPVHNISEQNFKHGGLENRSPQESDTSSNSNFNSSLTRQVIPCKPTASVKPFVQQNLSQNTSYHESSPLMSPFDINEFSNDSVTSPDSGKKKRRRNDENEETNESRLKRKRRKRQASIERLLKMNPDEFLSKLKNR